MNVSNEPWPNAPLHNMACVVKRGIFCPWRWKLFYLAVVWVVTKKLDFPGSEWPSTRTATLAPRRCPTMSSPALHHPWFCVSFCRLVDTVSKIRSGAVAPVKTSDRHGESDTGGAVVRVPALNACTECPFCVRVPCSCFRYFIERNEHCKNMPRADD